MEWVAKLRQRKIAGVPAIWLVAALVVGLAVFAWRLRPAPDETPADYVDGEDSSATVLSPVDLTPDLPAGTVVVAPSVAGPDLTDVGAGIVTEEDWVREGTRILAGRSDGPDPVVGQRALQLYLEGSDLSYVQGRWASFVIRELGTPPGGGPSIVGKTGAKPKPAATVSAVKTKTNTPPKVSQPAPAARRTYVVRKGDNLSKIAARYGTTWQRIYGANRTQIKNPNLIYPGQRLVIP